eukprot:2482661-Prorocentrum_lima.AAC.1
MTSSLVGSEMCIRDRPTHDPNLRHKCRWRTSPRASHTKCYAALKMAVSYTHLTLPTICSV